MNFLSTIGWMSPPADEQHDDGRRRQAYFLAITIIVVGLLIGFVDLAFGFPTTIRIILLGLPLLLLSLVLIARRKTDAAVLLLMSVVLVILTVVLAMGNGIHSTGIVLHPVIVIAVGALAGRRAFITFLTLVLLSVVILATGEIYGFLPLIRLPSRTWWDDLIVVVLILAVAAVSIRLILDTRDRALRRAFASEDALIDKVRKLGLLREISLLYARELNLHSLGQKIDELFPRYFKSTSAELLIYDPVAGGLISDERLGFSRPGSSLRGSMLLPGESISGKAFAERRLVRIDDCLNTEIIPKRWVEELSLRTSLAIPLLVHDRALGVLRIDNTERARAFTDDDVDFFQMLADQVAVAVNNQEMFEERRRVEEALREGESRFRLLSDNVSDVIWSADLALRFRFISHSAKLMFGWEPDEWLSLTPQQYLPPHSLKVVNETLQLELDRNREPGVDRTRSINLEVEQQRKDQTLFWTEVTARFLWNEGRVPVGIIGVTRDITERKQAEAKILRLNAELEGRVRERTLQLELANQEMESFSYSVSHDLRAPLRHILGFLKLLEGELRGQLGEDGSRYLHLIETSAQRMARLIDDLLRLSRLSRSEMRKIPTDLTGLASAVWSRLESTEPGRTIRFTTSPTTPVCVDPGLLEVVIENLLSNARKFTSRSSSPSVIFGELLSTDGPVFFVRDNGAGFDMTYAGKLFGVFQRLHDSDEFPGTGIGLATVFRIIERHRGRIWAEGEVDRGATFYFTLPSA